MTVLYIDDRRHENRPRRFMGLSTDTKPSGSDLPVGSTFEEDDSGYVYKWDGSAWIRGSVQESRAFVWSSISSAWVRQEEVDNILWGDMRIDNETSSGTKIDYLGRHRVSGAPESANWHIWKYSDYDSTGLARRIQFLIGQWGSRVSLNWTPSPDEFGFEGDEMGIDGDKFGE